MNKTLHTFWDQVSALFWCWKSILFCHFWEASGFLIVNNHIFIKGVQMAILGESVWKLVESAFMTKHAAVVNIYAFFLPHTPNFQRNITYRIVLNRKLLTSLARLLYLFLFWLSSIYSSIDESCHSKLRDVHTTIKLKYDLNFRFSIILKTSLLLQ